MNIDQQVYPHYTGIMGSMTSLLAVIISVLPHVEQWLRITSLAFGTLAAIVSIWLMIEKRNNDKKDK
jgi:membrane protein implicated in regulation of membrane protease activity